MLRVHCFGFAFTPKLIPTVCLVIGLPVLTGLGVWQLHRADEKRQLLTQFHSRNEAILSLSATQKQPLLELQYRRIRLTGHFDNAHTILLDNKILHHRVGYEVLTPFLPNHSKQRVVVNRGWIASTGQRQQLPAVQPISGRQTIEGLIKMPSSKVFVLSNKVKITSWPLLMQALDLKKIGKAYQKPLYPFIVLLSPKSPGGFEREWRPTVITPAKHVGYAVQWFALALTFVIIYLVISTKRGRHDKSNESDS